MTSKPVQGWGDCPGHQLQPAESVADRPTPYDLIIDALAISYEIPDDLTSAEFWAAGAALIVTTLIDFGWMPPEADPVLIDGSSAGGSMEP